MSSPEETLHELTIAQGARDETWRRLYDRYADSIYRLLLRTGVLRAEAEDLVQEVFVIAHRRVEGGLHVENAAAFLRGVAVKLSSRHHRWARVRRLKQKLLAPLEGHAVPADDDVRAKETAELLMRLPPAFREVLVLCELEELSPREVAEALEIPVNTVRSRRRLARERLRRAWHARGEAR